MPETNQVLEVFTDPMCPYAYQTSVWLRSVRAQTGLAFRWRFFSLEEVNRLEGKKHPWERDWSYGWSQMRVGALLRRQSDALVDDWYAALGKAFHEDGRRTHVPEEHRRLLEELGLSGALVDEALADPSTSDEVRADHCEAVERYGAFGVPTLVFPSGDALFGPVVVPAPTGEDAVRLWGVVETSATFPHLYELRRPKTADDMVHIARAFEPYLRSRDWQTIENPSP